MDKAIHLTQAQTLLVAVAVFFVGTFFHAKSNFLKKYNIPEPVIGGIIASIFLTAIHFSFHTEYVFDNEVYSDLSLTFFATVGLTAKFSFLKKGGRKIFIFFVVAGTFLILQNATGVFMSRVLGIDPNTGLLAGSITLSGGHATGAVYSKLPFFSGVPNAAAVAIAFATFGLVLGGIIGGPISQLLIARHKLAPEDKVMHPDDALKDHGYNEPETVTARSVIQVLLCTFFAIYFGKLLYTWVNPLITSIFGPNASVANFIFVLLVGVVITNLCDLTHLYKVHDESTNLINTTSLTIFLSIAMMNLKLWKVNLAEMAVPLLGIILVQTILMALFAYYITFRALGKDYDAAVIAGGHCGFGLGSTTTAVANVESVTNRYGEAPRAMFTILMVGAFFIDIFNALVVQAFMYFIGKF